CRACSLHRVTHSSPTRRSSDLSPRRSAGAALPHACDPALLVATSGDDRPEPALVPPGAVGRRRRPAATLAVPAARPAPPGPPARSEEHTSELQSLRHLVCRLLL